MDKTAALIQNLAAFKKRLAKTMDVEKMILFGSHARRQAGQSSDVDLILVSNDFESQRFRFRPLQLYKYWSLRLPVDFLCYTPKEFEERSRRITIVREALSHGIEIA